MRSRPSLFRRPFSIHSVILTAVTGPSTIATAVNQSCVVIISDPRRSCRLCCGHFRAKYYHHHKRIGETSDELHDSCCVDPLVFRSKAMARSPRTFEYVHLRIRVDQYQVAVGKCININLLGEHESYLDNDDPVFTSDVRFEITGMCVYPESRANEKYEITIYEEDVGGTEPKVKDIHVRSKDGVPLYHKRRGREIPVYNLPAGFCLLRKNRYIGALQACIWVAPQLASETLAVLSLSNVRSIYIAMDERAHERKRWIDSLHVQTSNPAEE
jgi:hypothetical protein